MAEDQAPVGSGAEVDPIRLALAKTPLPPKQKAAVFDALRAMPDMDAVTTKLKTLPLSNDLRDEIWQAKRTQLETEGPPPRTWGQVATDAARTVGDVRLGVLKGTGETAYGLAKLAHDYTPLGRLADRVAPGAFDPQNKPRGLEATNTAQAVGKTAEQIGEFFIPTGLAGKAGKAAEIAKAALLTRAQGGSNAAAGVSAAITAAVPGAAPIRKLEQRGATALTIGAEKNIAQAVGATKEWAKSATEEMAPEIITRGIRGSRDQMLELATTKAREVGTKLQQAYESAAQAGETVAGGDVLRVLSGARQQFFITGRDGLQKLIPGTERLVAKLRRLEGFVADLPDDIPVDKAAYIKRTWDWAVSKAGLYGQKAAANATDNANAWALREGASSFRELLNKNPTLAELNKEASFWISLRNVLRETEKRTQAQTGGLVSSVTGSLGAVAGFLHGGTLAEAGMTAMITGYLGRQMVRVLQSPWFKTSAAAPAKAQLAEALASGKPGRAVAVVNRMLASLPRLASGADQEEPADDGQKPGEPDQ